MNKEPLNPEPLAQAKKSHKHWYLLGGIAMVAVCIIAGLFIAIGPGQTIAWLKELLQSSVDLVGKIPAWAFVLIIAVVCSFPIPSSPLFIAAGLAYEPTVAIVASCLGIFANLLLSYYLAAWGIRGPIERIVQSRSLEMPKVKGLKPYEAILLVRFLPGVPLVIQSYLLGLMRVPIALYMLISWPIACISAIGLVLAGHGFYEGSIGIILLALSIIVCLGVAIKFIYNRLRISTPTL